MLKKSKIVILTESNLVWALPTWKKAIPLLQQNNEVAGFAVVPEVFGKRKGIQIPLWYLKVFGFKTTFLLAIFAIKNRMGQLMGDRAKSFLQLAKESQIDFREFEDPNGPDCVNWVRSLQADVLIIMIGNVIRSELISSVKVGVINKHASLLPHCKGIFPYFWAALNGIPQGFSFHQVTEKIDGGDLLVQVPFESEFPNSDTSDLSMLGFYRKVFEVYPKYICIAVERLLKGEVSPNSGEKGSYFSFPKVTDARRFFTLGNQIVTWKDVWA